MNNIDKIKMKVSKKQIKIKKFDAPRLFMAYVLTHYKYPNKLFNLNGELYSFAYLNQFIMDNFKIKSYNLENISIFWIDYLCLFKDTEDYIDNDGNVIDYFPSASIVEDEILYLLKNDFPDIKTYMDCVTNHLPRGFDVLVINENKKNDEKILDILSKNLTKPVKDNIFCILDAYKED